MKPLCESCERAPATMETFVASRTIEGLTYRVNICGLCASLPQTGEPLG